MNEGAIGIGSGGRRWTGGTIFSGGGVAESLLTDTVGMKLAVEFDEQIAQHYAAVHGNHVHHADVTQFNFSPYDGLDWLHSSPPCTRASVANSKGGETDTDWQLAKATVEAVRAIYPKVFTLENVWGYRNFQAFEWICDALTFLGYTWDVSHVNAADFGVPQIRKRLILRAWRKHKKPLPPIKVTHGDPKKDTGLLPWVGWYAATADLLPHCPETKLAPWQEKRLKAKYGDNFLEALLVGGGACSDSIPTAGEGEPGFTIKATPKEPMRAILVSDQSRGSTGCAVLDADSPAMSSRACGSGGALPRAVLVGGANRSASFLEFAKNHRKSIPGVKDESEPMFGIQSTSSSDIRVVMVEGDACGERCPTVLGPESPTGTVRCSGGGRLHRIVSEDYRVVEFTPACLARVMSMPDSYPLPTKKGLAVKIIGNGVPPLMMRKIVLPLLEEVA